MSMNGEEKEAAAVIIQTVIIFILPERQAAVFPAFSKTYLLQGHVFWLIFRLKSEKRFFFM